MGIVETILLAVVGIPLTLYILYLAGSILFFGIAGAIFGINELYLLIFKPEIDENGESIIKVKKLKDAILLLVFAVPILIFAGWVIFFD